MKRFLKPSIASACCIALVNVVGCGSPSDEGLSDLGENTGVVASVAPVSKSVTNLTPTTTLVNSAGVQITIPQGAVPKALDGSDQPLVLSLEKKAPINTVALPGGFTPVGESWLLGPQNFIFTQPIGLEIPFSAEDGKSYAIFHYNGEAQKWEQLASVSNDTSADTLLLARTRRENEGVTSFSDGARFTTTRLSGYFRTGVATPERFDPQRTGLLTLKNYYTVQKRYVNYCILKDSSILKYSNQHLSNYSTYGILGDGGDMGTVANLELPQGTYTIQLGRTKGDTVSRDERAQCDGWFEKVFSITGTGYIIWEDGKSQANSPDETIPATNANFALSSDEISGGGDGCTPCASTYPPPSALYGVGNIGATLNWSNRVADMDISLTTPSGEIIDFNEPQSVNGKIELDVDRMCTNIAVGDLTENIYSKAEDSIASGTYTVTVTLYNYCDNSDATPIPYSLRLVENGRIQTYTDTLTGTKSSHSYSLILRQP